MSEDDNREIQILLRRAMPPMDECGLQHDLWPSMLRGLQRKEASATWLDWALIAFLAVVLVSFPRMLPVLLYFL